MPSYEGGGAHGGGRPTRGVPDGLLVGGLAFVLGMAVLIWSATGLAGLFAHGGWPDGVTFTATPEAIRALLAEPHDIAAAWPETPSSQLSGYGLFWGIFVSQVMVLIVLTVFVLGTVARWRAVRRAARHTSETAGPDQSGNSGKAAPEPGDGRGPQARPSTRYDDPRGRSYDAADGRADAVSRESAPPHHHTPRTPRAHRTEVPEPRQEFDTDPRPPHEGGYGADSVDGSAGRPAAPVPAAAVAPTVPAAGAAGASTAATAATAGRETYRRLHYAPHPYAAFEAVQDAEGPALVVTADPALYSDTVGARGKLGPAHVYDPAQLTDAPTRLRWAPHRACEDMPTARLRAAALLAPVRSPARSDSAVHDAAETLLRCWLHAAAVAGEPIRQVHRWAMNGSSKEAVRILRTNGAAMSGAAGELEATLTAHPERREAATALVRRALGSLSQLHIRNACTPARADRVAWESFVPEGGTLYVVGEAIEAPHRGDPGSMPLLTALTSAVVEHGRRMAERSSAGRLDPPLTVVLDHPATVAPLPELPALLADGEAAGLSAVVLLRSEEQARTWWPELTRPPR